MEDWSLHLAHDKGYSFCNCRNIFFTNYKNIDKSIYDERYTARYTDNENHKTVAINEIEKLYGIFNKINSNAKSFLEIGSIDDYVLDYMKDKNFNITALNISLRESKHNLIVEDFEDFESYLLSGEKYDIIYASHIFEHFKDPKQELHKCHEMLTDDGILYTAMPDTFFIDFEHGNGQDFDWLVQEHYILWNMDNWVEFCEENGFKHIYSEHCLDLHKQTDGKWFWKKDYKVLYKKDMKVVCQRSQ